MASARIQSIVRRCRQRASQLQVQAGETCSNVRGRASDRYRNVASRGAEDEIKKKKTSDRIEWKRPFPKIAGGAYNKRPSWSSSSRRGGRVGRSSYRRWNGCCVAGYAASVAAASPICSPATSATGGKMRATLVFRLGWCSAGLARRRCERGGGRAWRQPGLLRMGKREMDVGRQGDETNEACVETRRPGQGGVFVSCFRLRARCPCVGCRSADGDDDDGTQ
jgi:hypothetical protein